MLVLENLTKSYQRGAVKAVDGLNLRVEAGEIFGFLGPNGAGKTTTIKMIVGLLNPDAGRVLVRGLEMVKNPLAVKRLIGYVPDQPDLYDRLTGWEYLNFIADVYGVSAAERRRRLGELLGPLEMESAVKDLIQSYSHGMKQKLALIAALIHAPDLWVLDEPMVGLDPKSAHLFKDLLRRHCAEGKAVFFSTHILEVAERLCDRVGIIKSGRLVACGTMPELRALRGEGQGTLENIFLELTE
ncbi:MAG: ABC transporter ATP-binding protein [Bacteroidota bacterium]